LTWKAGYGALADMRFMGALPPHALGTIKGGTLDMPTKDRFTTEITRILSEAKASGAESVDINSGDVHRAIGGYPPATTRCAPAVWRFETRCAPATGLSQRRPGARRLFDHPLFSLTSAAPAAWGSGGAETAIIAVTLTNVRAQFIERDRISPKTRPRDPDQCKGIAGAWAPPVPALEPAFAGLWPGKMRAITRRLSPPSPVQA